MTKEIKEYEPKPRYPFFGIVGPVGVGKTELLLLLSSEFGFVPLEEQFVENPYLEGFYLDDPKKFSFNSQTFFLAVKGAQTQSGFKSTYVAPTVQDPDMEGDGIIAETQWRMGFMTDEEYETYKSAFKKVSEINGFPQPDITLALTASEETVVKRIKERGREWELLFMERYPDYFRRITQTFNEWLSQNRYGRRTIVIDTDRFDLKPGSKDRAFVAKEIHSWTTYYVTSPHQLNGQTPEGQELLVPNFGEVKRNIHIDLPPGLNSQNRRLQGH